MENAAFYNGQITAINDMMIPANDRGFCFGDGIYEACIVQNHKIFALDDHLDRLENSLKFAKIVNPYTREELSAILNDLVSRVDAPNQFLYWQFTRGTAPRNHLFPVGVKANLYAYTKPFEIKDITKEYTIKTVEDKRFHICNVKTLNLLLNCMAAQEAMDAGCDEAVFVRDGYVTECAHSNIHILKNGTFITHPADNHILPGIERKHLIATCKLHGIPVEERLYTVDELKDADEILISSTSAPIRRAVEVDGVKCAAKDPELLGKLREWVTAYIEEGTR